MIIYGLLWYYSDTGVTVSILSEILGRLQYWTVKYTEGLHWFEHSILLYYRNYKKIIY